GRTSSRRRRVLSCELASRVVQVDVVERRPGGGDGGDVDAVPFERRQDRRDRRGAVRHPCTHVGAVDVDLVGTVEGGEDRRRLVPPGLGQLDRDRLAAQTAL